jgi:tetratricopeptide (TPR) repeat protein
MAYPRNVIVGGSYAFGRYGTAAIDIDNRLHIGLEGTPVKQIALRAGLDNDPDDTDRPIYTLGLGMKLSIFRFDYAYVDHPELNASNVFALSMAFNFNPSKVRIEQVDTKDIYASLYKSYAVSDFAEIEVENLSDEGLSTRFEIMVPEIAGEGVVADTLLRGSGKQTIPIQLVIPDRIMNRLGDKEVKVEVAATYQSVRLPRTDHYSTSCTVYGRNAIRWSDGVAQAAAFVTTRDAPVESLAVGASRAVSHMDPQPYADRNIRDAAAIYSGVEMMDISYVPDPKNPYSEKRAQGAVDIVHYPRETLLRKAGDCDDTSVLLAALLGNVGIDTRFVDAPSHLFLMFDSGVREGEEYRLGIDEDLYVAGEDGRLWIPLETTLLDQPFTAAWEAGATEYRKGTAEGVIEDIDISSAQRLYVPAAPVGEIPSIPALDSAVLSAQVAAAAEGIKAWRDQYGGGGQRMASIKSLNELARIHLLQGELDLAEANIDEILEQDANSSLGLNNKAVVAVADGDYEGALEHLKQAETADPADAGIQLNIGLVQNELGDTDASMDALSRGIEAAGGYVDACELLGVAPGEIAEGAGEQQAAQDILARAAVDREAVAGSEQPGATDQTKATKVPLPSEREGEAYLFMYWKE